MHKRERMFHDWEVPWPRLTVSLLRTCLRVKLIFVAILFSPGEYQTSDTGSLHYQQSDS